MCFVLKIVSLCIFCAIGQYQYNKNLKFSHHSKNLKKWISMDKESGYYTCMRTLLKNLYWICNKKCQHVSCIAFSVWICGKNSLRKRRIMRKFSYFVVRASKIHIEKITTLLTCLLHNVKRHWAKSINWDHCPLCSSSWICFSWFGDVALGFNDPICPWTSGINRTFTSPKCGLYFYLAFLIWDK